MDVKNLNNLSPKKRGGKTPSLKDSSPSPLKEREIKGVR